ncbi:hypothetical protein IQ260_18880 [Leptolyngbya cf. ectocarpi LEGE 11479]|uniref:Uncharacterized protein n=1 Tax=Leptolyngbya cf. ectocarpi LEGE 11479 TaxID=1828722 RepID=A0A928ZWK1_LEPEC|nr:hypothetical protein [Leptolyngbya ectocarpi]MBE9068715.1 hypothetical protein [Leptolyngbya cf. ectocarpi LEGE 11479]
MTHTPHLRLTPADVKALWEQKLFNARSYLYLLAIAHRRVEWKWQIDNVSAFCEEWNIPRRTFYKAKAALILSGLLSENIVGSLELVPHACPQELPVFEAMQTECASLGTGVPYCALVVPKEAQPVHNRAHLTLETLDRQDVCASTSLKQLITPTTPSVCVNENQKPTVNNSEVRTEVGVTCWPTSQVENSESPNEATPPGKDTYAPPILLAAKKKFAINLADTHLRRALERWPERIEVAIACLEEKEIEVKYPTRFLQKAIEEQWKPEAQAKEKAPDDFREWFKAARERGLVVGSQRVDGQIMVYTVDERCAPFNELRQLSWEALTAQVQAITDDSLPVNTAPPEQNSEPAPELDPLVVLHRVNNAIVTQSPISPQLQTDADRCHIDIPQLQAEWELAASPPGSADDDLRQAG